MKIAYTFNGITGGLSGKNYDMKDQDNQKYLIKLVYKYIEENIIQHNDVDFFIFSWQKEQEDLFNELYKPKKSLFTEQIKFDTPPHLDSESSRVQAHYSSWYGFDEVMKLKTEYEEENNFKYDLVVNVRMDTLWNRPYDFSKLDVDKIHLTKHINRDWGWGNGNNPNELEDHIYVMNSDNMNKFSKMYGKLNEYTSPGQCPQWKSISSHFLSVWHLNKLGWLNEDTINFSFLTELHADNQSDETDYTTMRFRELTIENIKEIINES